MGKGTFRGGMHTYDGKDLSKDKPTRTLLPKGELVYPMIQHIGAPAKPIVKVGDTVLVGQKLAEPGGFISSCVISSVSGTVKAIEPRLTVTGAQVEAVIVENDNRYQTIEGFGEKREAASFTKDEIRSIVKEAGLVGMGGAGFPAHVKLTPKDDAAIDFVIVNGAECEPYLTSDYRMMLEETERLVGGLRVILRLFDNAKGIFAIEDNKPDCIEAVQRAIAGDDRLRVQVLKTKYPQGAERQLIYACTGRKITSKMLPSDVGCIVHNVDTTISIGMAVCESTKLIRRIITVTGDAVREPQNFNVPTGMHYNELVDAAGGFVAQPEKIISGGPMMGLAMYSFEVPVTKTSSALLAFLHDPVAEKPTGPCIRCGRCVAVCPSRIVPQKMYDAARRFDDEVFVELNGMECYECGCCTYVCPAGLKLTQAFKQTRRSILESRKKKA